MPSAMKEKSGLKKKQQVHKRNGRENQIKMDTNKKRWTHAI
jgi:hypothetical protein